MSRIKEDGTKKKKEKELEKSEKIKISIFPIFAFEVAVSTFVDKSKYEIVPILFTKTEKWDKYAQNVFGDWCYPLKAAVAMFEEVITEKGVTKIFSVNVTMCSYPLVLGDIQKWIKKKVEYYPISRDTFATDPFFVVKFFEQLAKGFPDFSLAKATQKIPLGMKRMAIADNMEQLYFTSLPLVRSPQALKTIFKMYKIKLINADNLKDSRAVFSKFKDLVVKQIVHEKPKYKFVLSGDASIITLDFSLFDMDVFLAKNGVQIIRPGYPNLIETKLSETTAKAKKIYSEAFSTEHNKVKTKETHQIEISTLHQILEGLKQKPDGIIYIKPNMCTPCDNLSYVLKKNDFFNYPFVEISYDEHSGVNGILTRLEAFINIVSERKPKKPESKPKPKRKINLNILSKKQKN